MPWNAKYARCEARAESGTARSHLSASQSRSACVGNVHQVTAEARPRVNPAPRDTATSLGLSRSLSLYLSFSLCADPSGECTRDGAVVLALRERL